MKDRQTAASENRCPWQMLSRDQLPLGWFLVLGWGFFCLLLAASPGPQLPAPGAAEPLPRRQTPPVEVSPPAAAGFHPASPPREAAKGRKRPAFQVDLNQATWVELAQLPGVGPVLAKRIVEYRRRHGNFHRVEQLLRVRGIGPRRLEHLRPFVAVDRAD